jgi:hypothetical protein
VRTPVGRLLGVLALALVLVLGVVWIVRDGSDVRIDAGESRAAGDPSLAYEIGPGPDAIAAPPRTLSFGATEVVEMYIGEDASAPVAITVHAIRRADVAALARARARGLGVPPHAYYVDATLTFEGLGVIEANPFLTLAEGSRETNVHHYRLETQRAFPSCPGTADGVTLRAGEALDICVVFPGPRPERVRGVSMLDEVGVPTWEGIVS